MLGNTSKWSLGLALIASFSLGVQAANKPTDKLVTWSYTGNSGAENWGKLDPAYKLCASGKEQSPIDIGKVEKEDDNELSFHYQAAPLWIMSDGTTELLVNQHPTVVNTGHSIQLNFPERGKPEYILIDKNKYRLIQLHFHVPGENTLNGIEQPMEVHLVHQKEGKLAVVGVWIVPGASNPVLKKIVEHFPQKERVLYKHQQVMIDINQLLPKNKSYYQFEGSLTTPPCSEGVAWHVMANTIEASKEEIEAIKKAAGGPNNRPVQALNDRAVKLIKE